ncbi:hypothetical protein AVEN_203824-1 [Araneus ventricosus]|uniref:Uncharacterized protein n=1 Tax=Araneus ventricosus TaxID=182803 RepID=A0A4Y2HZG6_ARAVE|nr:hypothetical protein AVEN_203824-1 [Araneus ventricosus]
MEFYIAHSVVSWIWKAFKTTGMCSESHGGGCLRSTTSSRDRYMFYRQKGTVAPQISRWKMSFLLLQDSGSPEKLPNPRLPAYPIGCKTQQGQPGGEREPTSACREKTELSPPKQYLFPNQKKIQKRQSKPEQNNRK